MQGPNHAACTSKKLDSSRALTVTWDIEATASRIRILRRPAPWIMMSLKTATRWQSWPITASRDEVNDPRSSFQDFRPWSSIREILSAKLASVCSISPGNVTLTIIVKLSPCQTRDGGPRSKEIVGSYEINRDNSAPLEIMGSSLDMFEGVECPLALVVGHQEEIAGAPLALYMYWRDSCSQVHSKILEFCLAVSLIMNVLLPHHSDQPLWLIASQIVASKVPFFHLGVCLLLSGFHPWMYKGSPWLGRVRDVEG